MRASIERGGVQAAIAYQPVMVPTRVWTRPARPRVWYRRMVARRPSRAWALVRLVGLVVATALGAALVTALVAGAALFALMTLG